MVVILGGRGRSQPTDLLLCGHHYRHLPAGNPLRQPHNGIMDIRDWVAGSSSLCKVSSGESTFTIASAIMPTLKQFRLIHWVNISMTRTAAPNGRSDAAIRSRSAWSRRSAARQGT